MACLRLRLRFLAYAAVLLAVPLSSNATAQDSVSPVAHSFQELMERVRPGTEVSVVDTAGREVSGEVRGLSPASLTIAIDGAEETLSENDVIRVVRPPQGMSRAKGAWIGAGLGLGTALGIGAACAGDSNCPDGVLGVAAFGVIGGPIIGALVTGRTDEELLYQVGSSSAVELSLTPVLTRRTQGLVVAATW